MPFGKPIGKLKEPITRIEEPDSIHGRRSRFAGKLFNFRGVRWITPRSKIVQLFAGRERQDEKTVKMPRRPHKTGGLV